MCMHTCLSKAAERSFLHLGRMLGHQGPFWGRQYIFWNNRRPLTVIHEVFSPALQRYIGPLQTSRTVATF